MERTLVFPEEESVGMLFAADRAYCLDDGGIEWIGEAMGSVVLPDTEYVGLIFSNNVPMRRLVLKELDLSCIQLLYFRNPFELHFDELMDDLSTLERAVLDSHPNDEDCVLLSSLHGLRAIDLTESNISDAGVIQLCEIQSLESLVLSYTSVSDLGLSDLHNLVDLRELDLSLTMISTEALAQIGTLKKLEELRLGATGISDDGLHYLMNLQNLSFIDVSETLVSDEGIAILQAALGNCQIHF
ncbi:MAG: hypothetical protein K2X81_13285 [Candidatus Obscuribacterales bacterium]|nr:hypothetical protein [Candidatus Obscuribacterales bacterium]